MGNLLHRPHLINRPDDIAREDFGRYLDLERELHKTTSSLNMTEKQIIELEIKGDPDSSQEKIDSLRAESADLQKKIHETVDHQEALKRS